MKGVLWRVAKRLSYIQDARCLKFKAAAAKPTQTHPDRREFTNCNNEE